MRDTAHTQAVTSRNPTNSNKRHATSGYVHAITSVPKATGANIQRSLTRGRARLERVLLVTGKILVEPTSLIGFLQGAADQRGSALEEKFYQEPPTGRQPVLLPARLHEEVGPMEFTQMLVQVSSDGASVVSGPSERARGAPPPLGCAASPLPTLLFLWA